MMSFKVSIVCAALVVQSGAFPGHSADSDDPDVWWPWKAVGGEGQAHAELVADLNVSDGSLEEANDSDNPFPWWPWGPGDQRSPFEKYRDASEDHCPPFLSRSTCPDSEYKGLVVYFHGYSACAEQIRYLAPHINDKCLDVFSPTSPGHGGRLMNCDAGEHCDVFIGGGQGFDLRELPTHAHQYRRFVWHMNWLVHQERNTRAKQTGKPIGELTVAAMGLSFGAPMAQYAIMSWKGLYTLNLGVNPYFGVGPDLDKSLIECEHRAKEAREAENWFQRDWRRQEKACRHQKIMDWLGAAGIPDQNNMILDWVASRNGRFERTLMAPLVQISDVYGYLDLFNVNIPELKNLLEGQQTWGENCGPIQAGEQKGFCAFKASQLLATHSFSQHVLIQGRRHSPHSFPETQILTTQTDGRSRNGMTYAFAAHLTHSWLREAPAVSMCMYRGGTVPHANLDKPQGWWNEHLYGQITHFLSGQGPVTEDLTPVVNAGECSALPLEWGALKQNPDLHDLVLPEAAPIRASNLWPDPLWHLLRHNFKYTDLVKGPIRNVNITMADLDVAVV